MRLACFANARKGAVLCRFDFVIPLSCAFRSCFLYLIKERNLTNGLGIPVPRKLLAQEAAATFAACPGSIAASMRKFGTCCPAKIGLCPIASSPPACRICWLCRTALYKFCAALRAETTPLCAPGVEISNTIGVFGVFGVLLFFLALARGVPFGMLEVEEK